MIEVEAPDGTVVEFPAGTAPDVIRRVMQSRFPPARPSQRNPDGTYGQIPEGFVQDPQTGQYTTREWMANNMQPSRAGAAATAVGQGVSFGGFDEAMGGVGALLGQGDFMRERARAQMDAAQRDFPGTALAGEAGGGVATALTYGLPALAGRGLLGAMGAGAGVGGAEGLAYGFLSGEGGAGERAQSAAQTGLLGALVGAGAPVVMRGAGTVGRGVLDLIGGGVDRALGRGSQGRAGRALADTVSRSGSSADDVAAALAEAARQGQPEFRAVDALGQAGQRRLAGVVRAGGEGADAAADFLTRRQAGQGDRVASFVADAFDASRSAADTQSWLRTARADAANIAYDAARREAGPVDVRGALEVIDSRVGPMQGSGVAGDSIDAKLAQFRNRLAADPARLPDGINSRELSDFNRVLGVKQDIQDAAEAARRAGRNNEARTLDGVWRQLDEALEAASAPYRAANDQFREMTRVIEAVEAGQQMARPGSRAVDNAARFSSMTGDQQAAARTGYGDALLRRIEATAGPATNRARPLTSSKIAGDAQSIAIDPDLLMSRIGRENTMHETMNRALGGSRTADNLADISDISQQSVGLLTNVLSGRPGVAAGQVASMLGDAFAGMSPGTRQIVADALLAPDANALRAAVARARTAAERQEVLNALARIGTIQNPEAVGMGEPRGLLTQ